MGVTMTQWSAGWSGHWPVCLAGYNESSDATIKNVFATAAMRFGHTFLPATMRRADNQYRVIEGSQTPLSQVRCSLCVHLSCLSMLLILYITFVCAGSAVVSVSVKDRSRTHQTKSTACRECRDVGFVNFVNFETCVAW